MSTASADKVMIRRAVPDDSKAIWGLIKELADYEKAPEEAILTVEQIREDGWGAKPIFNAFVAELDGVVRGMALCYYSYSTWKGRCLYLEDLYVQPDYRRMGIGFKLIYRCAQEAIEQKCARLSWQVLTWNTPAIEFYKKRVGAEACDEWLPMRLTRDGLDKFVHGTVDPAKLVAKAEAAAAALVSPSSRSGADAIEQGREVEAAAASATASGLV